MSSNNFFPAYRYSLIICRNIFTKKFLCVQQTSGKWWIPGGKVQANETFLQAALRQCKQETGLPIQVKGIIRVDYGKFVEKIALRTVYYCQPLGKQQEIEQMIKKKEDGQSKRACFLSVDQIYRLQDKWRGRQIYDFPKYIDEGGQYYPTSILKQNFKFNQQMI